MQQYRIGIVVPVYQVRFLPRVLSGLVASCRRADVLFCIVNDGRQEVAEYLAAIPLPENVVCLNLPQTRCFAGANNAGWRHLLESFPTLRFLGSINDDTIPRRGWLEPLVDALERYPRTGLAMPVMQTRGRLPFLCSEVAAWQLRDATTPLVLRSATIKEDTFVSAINGFCFLARREALEEVAFFDERFRNSCEDADLALKLLSARWRLVVCARSKVFHYGGQSRYLKGTGTDIDASHALLALKWGDDLRPYNSVRPKTVAHCLAYNQEHCIEAWVRNAARYADELVVMYSKLPWRYNKGARRALKPDRTGEILRRLAREFPQLTVVQGVWDTETDQRNEALKAARRKGGGWLLIVDSDEFFDERIFAAFDWMVAHPAKLWSARHVQLIKRKEWAVVCDGGDPSFQFAIDLAAVRSFADKRTPDAPGGTVIPGEVCTCWHFSYLMPEEKLREKLASFGHAAEIREGWLETVWPTIAPGSRDFHPVSPQGWRGIREVEVPAEIVRPLGWLEEGS